MWKNWTGGILGILVILIPFAGISLVFERIVFVAVGIFISILAFWSASENRP